MRGTLKLKLPRILLTPGEPAGIGMDIVLQAAQQNWPAELIVIGSPEYLHARAAQLDLHVPDDLAIIPVELSAPCVAGQPDKRNAEYVIRCLEIATDMCLQHQAHALVTGPVHKGVINDAGIAFSGHTEFLAARAGTPHPVMLFVVEQMRVALVTMHVPLRKVADVITPAWLESHLRVLHTALQQKFNLAAPRIVVCGLNPHAGENGYLGREEIDVITPVLNTLRSEGFIISGPVAADTAFTPQQLALADCVVAMYHDQALPVVKYRGFGHAVNITLGLPFIRTSVDHGVAFDLAGTGKADSGSLIAAIKLAIDLI